MKVELDRKADAAYVELSRDAIDRQVQLDAARVLDLAADGSVVGVEFLSPSRGVSLDGIPRAVEIGRALRRRGVRVISAVQT
jgi:uncharacterized protein YuzE